MIKLKMLSQKNLNENCDQVNSSDSGCDLCTTENDDFKIPRMSIRWSSILTKVLTSTFNDNTQNEQDEQNREALINEIECVIASKYPDAKLSVFGSSTNGFALKNSDIDICTIFEKDPNGDKRSERDLVRSLGTLLKSNYKFDQVKERADARVPIVKFRHKKSNIEIDISFFNQLALHNTKLLRFYSEIDPRVRVLGCIFKYYFKVCKFGDASQGSLSSYACIVLVLNYLMSTEPPVLPCLQQLNRNKQELKVQGWDCWFYQDLSNLQAHWKGLKKNTQTIGELWVGFFRYYTEVFDLMNQVVSIRDVKSVSKQEKGWKQYTLAIEDPFEYTSNLTARVSPQMWCYILRSFMKALNLFGQENNQIRSNELGLNKWYFFAPISLVDGEPPRTAVRACYFCTGDHNVKNCPLLPSKKKSKKKNKQYQLPIYPNPTPLYQPMNSNYRILLQPGMGAVYSQPVIVYTPSYGFNGTSLNYQMYQQNGLNG